MDLQQRSAPLHPDAQHKHRKAVVLCADDYALNTTVSEGIVALAGLGRLSATSVMSLSPRWAQDASALREVRTHIDVGLHLDWTSHFATQAAQGRGLATPTDPHHGLAIKEGCGHSLGRVMACAVLRLYRQKTIEDEIERQLDAFETHWQATPDHIDGHQHIQQFPVFREALATVLLRRYGASDKRPWLRVSQVAQPGLKARVISLMGATALQQWAQRHAWPTVSPLLGVYGFDASVAGYAHLMQGWLAALPQSRRSSDPDAIDGHWPTEGPLLKTGLIMCHPAIAAQADDSIGAARLREFTYLASDDFAQHLHVADVQLVRGRDADVQLVRGHVADAQRCEAAANPSQKAKPSP